MNYDIYTYSQTQNDARLTELAIRLVSAIGKKHGREFSFKNASGNITKEILNDAKSARAILLTNAKEQDAYTFDKALGLYANVRRAVFKDFQLTVVSDSFGGDFSGEKGFRTNPTFGREAYDETSYSELEIERVARVAYEIAETQSRKLTLACNPSRLATSALWRKIVADINEDYPFVTVQSKTCEQTVFDVVNAPQSLGIILAPHSYEDAIFAVAAALSKSAPVCYSLGDTPLGAFGASFCNLDGNFISQASAISEMFRLSFDMPCAADEINRAVAQAINQNNTHDLSDKEIADLIISKL